MSELNLQSDGVMRVKYSPELKKAVTNAAKAWELFCALPLEEKLKLATDNTFNGVGYEYKVNDAISSDRKENFDYSNKGRQKIIDASKLHLSAEAINFLESILSLPELASQAILEVGRNIHTHTAQNETFEEIAQRSSNEAFFRFLHYPAGAEPGSVIAEDHTDNSGITLHLEESTDGCQKLDFDKKSYSPLPVAQGEAIAFVGMQAQNASEGEVTALCHRVVANETSAALGRFAVVCFTPLIEYPQYDKKRHGRLQEMTPGFNYGMHPDEFSDFFIVE